MAWSVGAYPSGSPFTIVAGTAMNNIATGAATTSLTVFDNTTNKDKYCDVFLHLDTISPGAGSRIDLYVLESIDASTFPSATISKLRNQTTSLFCSIPVDTAASTAQDIVVRGLLLSPVSMKFVLDNQITVDLTASNLSFVKIVTYND